MSAIDDILGQLPIDQLADQLGADPQQVQAASAAVLPALLGGLQANAGDGGASSILSALGQHNNDLLSGGIDLSQIDMRALAGLSGDEAYIDLFRSGGDPHAQIAQILFGDPGMREVAKPIGHGWNYGRGIKAIAEGNDLDPQIVMRYDSETREKFPRLVEWQGEVRAIAESGELLDNGFGRRMRPDPTRAHTQGPALMGQGCARDLLFEGLLRLPVEFLPFLRGLVHDEVVLSVPATDAEEIQRTVIDCLSFEWEAPSGKTVPITADGGPTDRTSWGDVYRKG